MHTNNGKNVLIFASPMRKNQDSILESNLHKLKANPEGMVTLKIVKDNNQIRKQDYSNPKDIESINSLYTCNDKSGVKIIYGIVLDEKYLFSKPCRAQQWSEKYPFESTWLTDDNPVGVFQLPAEALRIAGVMFIDESDWDYGRVEWVSVSKDSKMASDIDLFKKRVMDFYKNNTLSCVYDPKKIQTHDFEICLKRNKKQKLSDKLIMFKQGVQNTDVGFNFEEKPK